MPFYINPNDGTLAYDATLPDGAYATNDPNASGVKLAPKDAWYALGNNSRVYVRAGVPVPNAQDGKLALSYQAIDDKGTPPQGEGTIHPEIAANTFKLPGKGQFENQAWTGQSDWRGVPYAQYDTRGQPLSKYNNMVDQLQAAREWTPPGQQFARWGYGKGMLGNAVADAQGGGGSNGMGGGGLLNPGTAPRVAVDPTFAGGAATPPVNTPNFVPPASAGNSAGSQYPSWDPRNPANAGKQPFWDMHAGTSPDVVAQIKALAAGRMNMPTGLYNNLSGNPYFDASAAGFLGNSMTNQQMDQGWASILAGAAKK